MKPVYIRLDKVCVPSMWVMRDSACVVGKVKDTVIRENFRQIQVVASPVLRVRSLDKLVGKGLWLPFTLI